MSEEDLELLVTLDDPGEEEDTLNHLQAENALNDANTIAFGQGDWTCTLSRFAGATNDSISGLDENTIQRANDKFEIEVCTVTRRKNGEIVEQKVFYDLVGNRRQFGVI